MMRLSRAPLAGTQPCSPPMPDSPVLWLGHLKRDPVELRTAWATLSAAERDRADRFVANPEGERFVLRRAAVRRILAGVTGVPANALRIVSGPGGRPELSLDSCQLDFSVASSGRHVGVAMRVKGRIGLDLEAVAAVDREQVARWTALEAGVKVTGASLASVLDAEKRLPSVWVRFFDAPGLAIAVAGDGAPPERIRVVGYCRARSRLTKKRRQWLRPGPVT